MKRLALLLAVLIPATALAGPMRDDPEIRKLRGEIAAVKLDRSLNLTRDQARALLPLLKEATALRDQIRAEQEKHRPEIVKALTAVRDDLVKTGVVSEPSRKALQAARGEEMKGDLRIKIQALHGKARDILNPEQKARLHEFDPKPIDGAGEFDVGGLGPDDKPEGRHGPGRGAKMHKAFRVATSPEFIGLVEVRAR